MTHSFSAILTNGIKYLFYTDLEETNKMDSRPFLEFDLTAIKESYVHELKKFQKNSFNLETIFNTAEELMYTNGIMKPMAQHHQMILLDMSWTKYTLAFVHRVL